MTEHTKGKRHVGGDGTIIYAADGFAVANATVFHGRHGESEESKGNAKRIAACVNYCDGLRTDFLESGSSAVINECKRLVQQRDELVEACRVLLALDDDHQRGAGDEDVCYEVRAARAALAKIGAGIPTV